MKNIYHGLLIDFQFAEKKFIEKNFNIFAKRKSSSTGWTLYGIETKSDRIEDGIKKIQSAMKNNAPYYAHLYNDNEMIVIFKNKIFHVSPHISTWNEIIEFGKTLNIPSEQLDFWPNRFQDEIHYFKKEDYTK